MDRSFLSRPEVITASRSFVCVRLLSYENKEEAAFMKTFGAGKSGDVENTVFTIFDPEGKRMLTKASRGPKGEPDRLAAAMTRIAKEYPGKPLAERTPAIPAVANVRLAINVAACDHQPLLVIQAGNDTVRKKLRDSIGALAWDNEFIGKFIYVEPLLRKELGQIDGVSDDSAVMVVLPDEFGLHAKVLAQADANASSRLLAATMRTGLDHFQRNERSFWQHVSKGQRQGIFWETLTPVTDPMEFRAREKGRKQE